MAVELLPEPLWLLVEPMLPAVPAQPQGGRPPVPHRPVLTGILFLLRTGIPWDYLPRELGCGSASTLWRRLRDWQKAGIWAAIHQELLRWLARLGGLDWSHALVDLSTVRAVGAGDKTGPSPVDRRKAGSTRHVLTDGRGTPMALILTEAQRNDTTQCLPLLDAVPALVGHKEDVSVL